MIAKTAMVNDGAWSTASMELWTFLSERSSFRMSEVLCIALDGFPHSSAPVAPLPWSRMYQNYLSHARVVLL